MARVAVEKMTLKQIEALEEQIAEAKAKAASAAKVEVKAKIDALLDSSGLTITELYPHSGRRGKGESVAKYANPADSSQTWTGRGRRPAWLLAALKKGAKLENLEI